MLIYIEKIVEKFPDAKYVLIERKPSEVVESLLDFQLMEEYDQAEEWINGLKKQMDFIKNNHDVKCFNYRDLDKIEICENMWNYLLPGQPFNKERFYELDQMYINIMLGKVHLNTLPESLHAKFNRYNIN
jgi:hypothetical protein